MSHCRCSASHCCCFPSPLRFLYSSLPLPLSPLRFLSSSLPFPLSASCPGRRCFEEFLLDEHYGKQHAAATLVLAFLNEVKELYSEKPSLAYAKAKEIQEKYIDNRILRPIPSLWKNEDLLETFQRKMSRLQAKSMETTALVDKPQQVTNLKVRQERRQACKPNGARQQKNKIKEEEKKLGEGKEMGWHMRPEPRA